MGGQRRTRMGYRFIGSAAMKSPSARLGIALLIGLFSCISMPAAGAHAAPVVRVPRGQEEPATEVCASRDVLLLIDQSISLRTSDPGNARVEGAKALVNGIAGAGSGVSLSIAGFGNGVTEPRTFDLPAESEMANSEIDQVASQTNDGNTDYVLAILKASEYFENSAAPPDCQTLVWFTDGAYDIDDASYATYTDLTNVDEIKSRFEAAVCGPVPVEFNLDEPLADKVRDLQFVVRLIDLRVGNQNQADRANTDPVLDRLLTGGQGECGINGTRIEATQTAELVNVFLEEAQRLFEEAERQFAETQRRAGRSEVPCELLTRGVPASIVESVAALALPSSGTEIARLQFVLGDVVIASGEQSLQYELSSSDRSQSTSLSARVEGAEIGSCFVSLSASITAVGEPSLYDGASSTPAYLLVGPPGGGTSSAAGVGDQEVALTATFNGSAVPTTWDPVSRQWVAEIPTPSGSQAELEVAGVFTGNFAGLGSIEPLSESIPVKDVPSVPPVQWVGDSRIEGEDTLTGRLEVSPSANVSDQVCITLDAQSAIVRAADGSDLAILTIDDEQPACGPANKSLSINAAIEVAESSNDVGTVAVGFDATFEPAGEPPKNMGNGDVSFPEFTFSKPIDSSTQRRLAAILALASAALTYFIMQSLTAMQAKLQTPNEMLMVTSVLVRDPSNGRVVRAGGDAPIKLSDMRQVVGSRRRYELDNDLILRRRLSLNPFRRLAAVVESGGSTVFADPAAGASSKNQRRAPVPLRFGRLVLVTVGERNRIVAVVPVGTTPSTTASIMDEGLRRLDSRIRDAEAAAGPNSSDLDGADQPQTGASDEGTQPSPPPSPKPPSAPTRRTGPTPAPPPPTSTAPSRKPPPPPYRA
jgi:hypothetical protein